MAFLSTGRVQALLKFELRKENRKPKKAGLLK